MKIADWIASYHQDRARFDGVTFGWPADHAEELRRYVALILDELDEAHGQGDVLQARVEALRGDLVEPPDLLALSGLGDVLPGVIAGAARDGLESKVETLDLLITLAIARVANLQAYHRTLRRAVAIAEHVASLQLQIRTLSAADGDPLLGTVSDAAYRWPVWTFATDVYDRAIAADVAISKVERTVELGLLDALTAASEA